MSTETIPTATYPFYHVSKFSNSILELQAVKHTDKSVWIKGKWSMGPDRVERSALQSEWGSYFQHRLDAVFFLRARLNRKIEEAQKTIEAAQASLAELK